MKKYLLLRNNSVSGPYVLEDLQALLLEPKDLVWIEEVSTAWTFATSIEELKPFVEERPKQKITPVKRVVVHPSFEPKIQHAEPLKVNIRKSQEEVDEQFEVFKRTKLPWYRKGLSGSVDALKLAAIFSGVIVGASLMKKAVDGFEGPIAEPVVPSGIISESAAPAENIKTALLTEVMPARTEKKIKKLRPVNIKKHLSVKAGNYKTGLLGGVQDLELTVSNTSPYPVDKVTVSVQYLKRNGEVIQTDNYEVFSLRPFATKLVSIPDSKRGVKVNYKIVEVKSKDHDKSIRQV